MRRRTITCVPFAARRISRISLVCTLSSDIDPDALGARWRALEDRATCSFFQSWTWVGCRLAERFADPVLLTVRRGGEDVALGLFNRHPSPLARRSLRLNANGNRALDAIYVEHNGLLHIRSDHAVVAKALDFLLRCGDVDRLILPGVDDLHLAAAQASGAALRIAVQETARTLDLAALPSGPDGFLASRSANTRAQIRRSERAYRAEGKLAISRAASEPEAQAWFDALGVLHQATWTSRGKPGAFANPEFIAFHRELIARAGESVIGYLYNFRRAGSVLTYQSGFAYPSGIGACKPGITTHALAIEMYRAEGARIYDFLAGEDRYKTSLSNAEMSLHWLDLSPKWSARGVLTRLRGVLGR
jgi:CelD/BcsL family acetyltransferase involved in cellulose biosynthesis